MSKTILLVSLAALNLKAGTQFRAALDDDAVKDYTHRLKEWATANTTEEKDGKRVPKAKVPPMEEWTKCPLPAITVFETETDGTINADGFHRIKAAKGAGLDTFPAEVKKGTKEEAVLYALSANAGHGVRLTNEDKANKLKAALKIPTLAELSNNALANKIGVSEFFVRTNRPAGATPAVRVAVTKSGEKKTVNTKNIGKKGGNTAKKAAAAKKAAKKSGKKDAAGTAPGTTGTGSTEGMSEEEKALAGALGGEGSAEGTTGTGTPDAKKFDDDTEKALDRIKKAVSDVTDPDALESAIRNGTVEISTADIRFLGGCNPERIALAYSLVFGDKRMKPKAALAFLDKIPDGDTKLSHFFNMTVARRGIVVETVENTAADPESGYVVVVIPRKGNAILRNIPLGSLFTAPAANKDAALKALTEA